MTDFITLSCPSCGAALSVSTSAASLKCGYCGNEHLVRRQGREISLEHINIWSCPQVEPLHLLGQVFVQSVGFLLRETAQNVKIASTSVLFFVQNVEAIFGKGKGNSDKTSHKETTM